MNWSHPVDLYCERLDATFWAEPVNALSNAAFLIAAAVAFLQWRRAGTKDGPVAALIGITAAIGIGSFIFHTVATRGAALFDTVPIAVFIYGYLLLALRRFLALSALWTAVALVAYAVASVVVVAAVPREVLNGSVGYLPALAALVVVGWLSRDPRPGHLLLSAALVFAVSIMFRSSDMALCDVLPVGTHFLWHLLNGLVLYLALRAMIAVPAQATAASGSGSASGPA